MSIGSILLGLSLLILVGLVLAQPFFAKEAYKPRPRSRKQQLLMQKEAVLEEIRALDFEYDTGKLPQDDYEGQRTALMAVATETLKALDELETAAPQDDVVIQIEAAINRVRTQHQAAGRADLPTIKAAAVVPNGAAKFCTACGTKVDASDKFCAACGHKIAVPV